MRKMRRNFSPKGEKAGEAPRKRQILDSAILDAAADLLVMVLDHEGRIVQFNQVCQKLSGYSLDEVKGRKPWEFLAPADEAARVRETFEKVVHGMQSRSESHWLARDGRRLVIRWSSSGVTVRGSVKFVIDTGIDRTEGEEASRRAEESESTVHALLETAAQAILVINQEGRIVLANGASERMFGYSRNELVEQTIEKLIPERFRERHIAYRRRWFERPSNREMGKALELVGLRKDGTEIPVDVSLSYVQESGVLLGVGFISDVTERKKHEAALLDYQRQLQELTANLMSVQEAGNEYLARELHDVFSQELAALGMEVSTLRASSEVSGPIKKRLAELGTKIGRLAEQMHDTSRRLHPALLHELGLKAALQEECDKFSEYVHIPIDFKCEDVPTALPEGVALCLYRVAQESLLNIRKHAGATSAILTLQAEGCGISLHIEDTGDGFNVQEARKRGGLGLVSMEERVRLVNGKFDIRSTPGDGTTVKVFVPLNKSAL
jgi:PAS domain S-box-containing protein